MENLLVVDFHSHLRKILTLKPLGFSFNILVFFAFEESLNLTVSQRYGFFSVLAAVIRESSDKQLVSRSVNALPFIYQSDRVAPKASDVSAADWLYQHT